MDEVYTVLEVAAYLKICKSKMYYLVKRGDIPSIKIGKNARILESDLIEWLEEQHRPAKQMGFNFPE